MVNNGCIKNMLGSARFSSTYTKIGMIQRRLAWPLHKNDTQTHEAFHIFAQVERERQIPYDFTHMWNLINKATEQRKKKREKGKPRNTLNHREQTDGCQKGGVCGDGLINR